MTTPLEVDTARGDVVKAAKKLDALWEYDSMPYATYDDDLMVAEERLLEACNALIAAELAATDRQPSGNRESSDG